MIESWLLGATITTIASIVSFGLVLFYFDPETSGWLGLVLLLISFIVALLGSLTIFGYRLRAGIDMETLTRLSASFRQSSIISFFVLVLLLLSRFRLYRSWQIVLAIVLAVGIETYLRLGVKYRKPTKTVTAQPHDGI